MRSFRELIVHILSGNVYAAKAGRGEKVNWDELERSVGIGDGFFYRGNDGPPCRDSSLVPPASRPRSK